MLCRGVSSRGAYAPDESNQGGHMPPSNYAPEENISASPKNGICPDEKNAGHASGCEWLYVLVLMLFMSVCLLLKGCRINIF